MNLGQQLINARESAGYTRSAAADLFEIPYSTFANYETGAREPGSIFLVKASEFYGVTVDYLLGIERQNNECSVEELNILKKYRQLDQRGQAAVLDTLNREYDYLHEPIEIKTAARGGGVQIEKTTRAEDDEFQRRVKETADEAAEEAAKIDS